MRVGIIGTGAISHKHAQAYKNIGYEVTACTDINETYGQKFADQYGCEFIRNYEDLCRHPLVDYVDVCTFPDFRLQPLEICAESGKHIQVQKPMATNLDTAADMIRIAADAGIVLGVVSQHRFADSLPEWQTAESIATKRYHDAFHPDSLQSITGLAMAHLGLDQPAEALALAQRGMKLVASHEQDANPTSLADLRFTLARAMWETHGDHKAARGHAIWARDAWAKAGT